ALHPAGCNGSLAYAAKGGRQVGEGDSTATGGATHALLWSGNAGSAIDLNPTNLTGFLYSHALGLGGAQQVGYGVRTGASGNHALLWTGTADSAVDLDPTNLSGFVGSR